MITREQLTKLFEYDPETGSLVWRVGTKIGHRAGARDKAQAGGDLYYIRVRIEGRRWMAHTLIWCLMTGEWRPRGIDHKDRDGTNNRWNNLRRATWAQNVVNTRAKGISGLKGVTKRVRGNCIQFYATMKVDGHQRHLGSFRTAQAAHEAYLLAARPVHGEFVMGG